MNGKSHKSQHSAHCGLNAPPPVPIVVSALRKPKTAQRKEAEMRRNMMWVTLLGAAITVTGLSQRQVMATPASGFTGTTIALGKFGPIDVFNQALLQDPSQETEKMSPWLSMQKTKGVSDLYVQSNVWKSISDNQNIVATTGWHTHPGHSLIIVTAGTVTVYEGDDSACTPHVYTAGMGFVDAGGDHVHNIRNESQTNEARTITVQLIPARLDGSPSAPDRRQDAANPGNCPF
jgi:cupin domain